MPILVSDTSIVIELGRGQFFEAVFASGMTLVVPNLLYEAELVQENGPYLRALGLGVLSLDGEEMEVVQLLQGTHRALSSADRAAWVCARRPDHWLLTGDGKLRAAAEKDNITVRGALWILDHLEAAGKISMSALHSGLSQIAADPRCWLPKHEITLRLEKWSHG